MTEIVGAGGHPALTDSQTRLPNRLHWDTVFGVIFAAGDRGIPLTLILVEAGHFSDWYSSTDPMASDSALKAMGVALARTTRQTDVVARVEENRFAFVLLDCNMAGGRLVADRIDSLLDPIREMTGLSFSLGVSVYNPDMARHEDLVGAAEEALRAAKALGENQTEFYR